ncbi:hypothetical protein Tco_0238114 [Tanacetum coccineum]
MRLSMKMKMPQCVETPIRRSARIPRAPERYDFHVNAKEHELQDHSESTNYIYTLSDLESDECLKTMNVEMLSVRLPSSVEVMSTPTHFDSEISSQTVKARSSRVPTPLPDDPYVAHAHLVDTDTESEPGESPLEVEEFQPLVSRAPLTGEEFEVSEPSDTRIVTPRQRQKLVNTT